MAEPKGTKNGSGGRASGKTTSSKRRNSNSQTQTKKPPTKATLKQLAKDWEHVT